MKACLRKFLKLSALITGICTLFAAPALFAATAPNVTNTSIVTEGVSSPIRLAEDLSGNLYLTDPRAGGILKYDATGKLITSFPVTAPQGIEITPPGDIIVSQGDSVSVLNSSGALKFKLGKGAGQFKMANGIALDTSGYIYVVDSLDDCVQVFNPAGTPVTIGTAAAGKPTNSFGSTGNQSGQLSQPTGIAFEKTSSQVAVVDTLNGRIQFFDTTGSYQKTVGSFGSGPLKFTSPQAISFEYSIDANKQPVLARMYVADSFQSKVQVIDPAGKGIWLRDIGSYGTGTGKLQVPSDVLLDQVNTSRLIVVNGTGNLTLFGLDGWRSPLVDLNPPPLTISPVPATVSTNSITISGTVETGAVLTITTDTGAVAGPVILSLTTDPLTTSWSSLISGLVAGLNTITVTAKDSASLTTTQTASITFDATAVALTLNAVTSPTGSLSQTISGTVEAGATVTVTNVATGVTNAATVTDTSWSYAATLVDGLNNFTITASKAPKANSSTSAVIVVLRTLPDLAVSFLSDNSFTGLQLQNIYGTVTANTNFDKITVTLNGGQPVIVPVTNNSFSYSLLLSTGVNTIRVDAYDKAGNNSSVSRTITYDPSRTSVQINAPSNLVDGAVTSASSVTLSGSVTSGSSLIIKYLSGGSPQTITPSIVSGSWTATVNLDTGLNSIEVVVTDSGGLTSSAVLTVTRVNIDKPTLAISSPANSLATNSIAIPVSGVAGAATVTATLNGISVPVSFVNGAFSLNPAFVAEGQYTLAVTAIDLFGNETTSYRNFIFDSTSPLLTIAPFSGQPITLSGTLEPGARLFIKDISGNDIIAPIVVGTDSTWSIVLPLAYDPSAINLFALDAAGNSTRNGRLNGGTSQPDITDAVKANRIIIGQDTATANQLLYGDVAPMVNHVSRPDGKIDIDDLLLIMRKVVKLPW